MLLKSLIAKGLGVVQQVLKREEGYFTKGRFSEFANSILEFLAGVETY